MPMREETRRPKAGLLVVFSLLLLGWSGGAFANALSVALPQLLQVQAIDEFLGDQVLIGTGVGDTGVSDADLVGRALATEAGSAPQVIGWFNSAWLIATLCPLLLLAGLNSRRPRRTPNDLRWVDGLGS